MSIEPVELSLTGVIPLGEHGRLYAGIDGFPLILLNYVDVTLGAGYAFPTFSGWPTHHAELRATVSGGGIVYCLGLLMPCGGYGFFPTAKADLLFHVMPNAGCGSFFFGGGIEGVLIVDPYEQSADRTYSAALKTASGWKL